MKKEYLKPEMSVSLFDTKDVITASESSIIPMATNPGESGSIGIIDGASPSVTFKYGE